MSMYDREWYRNHITEEQNMDKPKQAEQHRRAGSQRTPPHRQSARTQNTKKKILEAIHSLPGRKRVITDYSIQDGKDRAFFDYIVIHEAGIFEIQLYDQYRIVSADGSHRYWTVEAYESPGVSYVQEFPTRKLEKDSYVLDQYIRRFAHVKSFTYAVFPDDAGVRNASTVNTDQVLAASELSKTLKSAANHYGHAYNNDEIDKIYRALQNSSASSRGKPVRKQTKRPRKGVRIAGALIMLILAVVAILVAETDISQRAGQTIESITGSITERFKKEIVPIPGNAGDVVITIPSSYTEPGLSQTECDQMASRYGARSIRLNQDGSMTWTVSSTQRDQLIANLAAEYTADLKNIDKKQGVLHFVSASANDDFSEYMVVVNSLEMSQQEKALTGQMIRCGERYALLSGKQAGNVKILFMNQNGQLVRTINSNS